MRYFFNYRDPSRYLADSEGTELSNLDAARADARLAARELLGTEHGESDENFSQGVFEIGDEAGALVAKVTFGEAEREA